MWGGAAQSRSGARTVAGKLWHFDINDGYRLKHDVDIAVGLVNPLDWLNVLMLLRSNGFNGPFNLDFKPLRTTSNHGVFAVSFSQAVDRFITLGKSQENARRTGYPEATAALKAGSGVSAGTMPTRCLKPTRNFDLHELIPHRLVQLLLGMHRGRTDFS